MKIYEKYLISESKNVKVGDKVIYSDVEGGIGRETRINGKKGVVISVDKGSSLAKVKFDGMTNKVTVNIYQLSKLTNETFRFDKYNYLNDYEELEANITNTFQKYNQRTVYVNTYNTRGDKGLMFSITKNGTYDGIANIMTDKDIKKITTISKKVAKENKIKFLNIEKLKKDEVIVTFKVD